MSPTASPVRAGREPGDNDLMRRIQAGSHEAFAQLYDRHCERAYRVARAVSADALLAEQAVQDGFAAIWKARAAYRPGRATAAAWLMTMIRHRAIDVNRRRAAVESQRVGDASSEDRRACVDVDGEVAGGLDGSDLRAVLGQLPDGQQEVIVLAFYGGLTHTEIAAQLGVPVGTVKGLMGLGLHKIRGMVEPAVA